MWGSSRDLRESSSLKIFSSFLSQHSQHPSNPRHVHEKFTPSLRDPPGCQSPSQCERRPHVKEELTEPRRLWRFRSPSPHSRHGLGTRRSLQLRFPETVRGGGVFCDFLRTVRWGKGVPCCEGFCFRRLHGNKQGQPLLSGEATYRSGSIGCQTAPRLVRVFP